ncbi:MAG: HEPN domain-containing protein [Deltaproteobacteria bacterium]|nr:HEPN domain-containing protein [Deltaproteobacteria bacterium]
MADLALAEGIFEEAVSSAYYAAHHSARALLFSLGLEVRSHDALRSLLGEHFVRDGRLPRDTAGKLKELFKGRLEADYGTHVHFTREQAESSVAWSRAFITAASDILAPLLSPSSARDRGPRYRAAAAPSLSKGARKATTPYRRLPTTNTRRPPTANNRRKPTAKSQQPIQQRTAKSQQR